MLTISELADFVGVTVRAVRHYHQRGLLAEPARDASGYRRYDADAVVELIRIKVLTDAGVPLARVSELLAADEGEFRQAVSAIDADLHAEIRRMRSHRERVARLAAGESLALPPEVVEYLEHLRRVGISEETVVIERDGWILLSAKSPPGRIRDWIRSKRRQLDDPRFRAMYTAFDQARILDPDDPRLEDLVEVMMRGLEAADQDATTSGHIDDSRELDAALVSLLDQRTVESYPGWHRLGEMIAERGWAGWTQIERVSDRT